MAARQQARSSAHPSLGATRLRRDLTKSSAACADHLHTRQASKRPHGG